MGSFTFYFFSCTSREIPLVFRTHYPIYNGVCFLASLVLTGSSASLSQEVLKKFNLVTVCYEVRLAMGHICYLANALIRARLKQYKA